MTKVRDYITIATLIVLIIGREYADKRCISKTALAALIKGAQPFNFRTSPQGVVKLRFVRRIAILEYKCCDVNTKHDLDAQIRDILALESICKSDVVWGTLHVFYTDESVKQASLIPLVRTRGVEIAWHKKPSSPNNN